MFAFTYKCMLARQRNYYFVKMVSSQRTTQPLFCIQRESKYVTMNLWDYYE